MESRSTAVLTDRKESAEDTAVECDDLVGQSGGVTHVHGVRHA